METAAGISDSRFYIETGGKPQALGAQTLYFEHEKRASLFYIRNKDTKRGFSISSDTASG